MQISKTQWIIIGVVVVVLLVSSICVAIAINSHQPKEEDLEPAPVTVTVYFSELTQEDRNNLYSKVLSLWPERYNLRIVTEGGQIYGHFQKNLSNGRIEGYRIDSGTGIIIDPYPVILTPGWYMAYQKVFAMSYTEYRL